MGNDTMPSSPMVWMGWREWGMKENRETPLLPCSGSWLWSWRVWAYPTDEWFLTYFYQQTPFVATSNITQKLHAWIQGEIRAALVRAEVGRTKWLVQVPSVPSFLPQGPPINFWSSAEQGQSSVRAGGLWEGCHRRMRGSFAKGTDWAA